MIAFRPATVPSSLTVVHLLDLLRVVGGEAGEDQHADDRDREAERRRAEEDVDDRGDDDADQAHEQERAHAGQVALGRVAPEAHRAEGRGGDEEHLGDARRRCRRGRSSPATRRRAPHRPRTSACAAPTLICWMRKLRKKTSASGARMTTHIERAAEQRLADAVEIRRRPPIGTSVGVPVTRASRSHRRRRRSAPGRSPCSCRREAYGREGPRRSRRPRRRPTSCRSAPAGCRSSPSKIPPSKSCRAGCPGPMRTWPAIWAVRRSRQHKGLRSDREIAKSARLMVCELRLQIPQDRRGFLAENAPGAGKPEHRA